MFLKFWYNTLTVGASNAGNGNNKSSCIFTSTKFSKFIKRSIVSTDPTATFLEGHELVVEQYRIIQWELLKWLERFKFFLGIQLD